MASDNTKHAYAAVNQVLINRPLFIFSAKIFIKKWHVQGLIKISLRTQAMYEANTLTLIFIHTT